MALSIAIAAVVILALLLLALAYLGRDRARGEPLGDDLIVRELRPRGNVRRIGGDDE